LQKNQHPDNYVSKKGFKLFKLKFREIFSSFLKQFFILVLTKNKINLLSSLKFQRWPKKRKLVEKALYKVLERAFFTSLSHH